MQSLYPEKLWSSFADLNAVPRPSKKEERVISFIRNFGESLGLDTIVDKTGNVLIKKPGTQGRENFAAVVLQSHLDMVHQKNESTVFDFNTQGIDMYIDGDWVKARGTTLGADNGIGVAAIMAILASDDIEHPPLEALFTIDEETGMTGAIGLEPEFLSGKILLNLDTEDDRELTIGCAGGIDVSAKGSYSEISNPFDVARTLTVKGLKGGHSGMDIHLGLGNANKILTRILFEIGKKVNFGIAEIKSGGLRNAIPREGTSIITFRSGDILSVEDIIAVLNAQLKSEYKTTDPDLTIEFKETDNPSSVIEDNFRKNILRSLYSCPNGIYRMSPDIPGLVQTSNNLASISISKGKFAVNCLTRSAVESEKYDLTNAIVSAFELSGAEVTCTGGYPGWEPKPDSTITKTMSVIYREMFNEEPHVNACHAGLECGIIGKHYPEMEMISFGPNIRGAHSPDEKVQISSVKKFWDFLLETLRRIQ